MGQPRTSYQVRRAAEAQEVALLSKHYPIERTSPDASANPTTRPGVSSALSRRPPAASLLPDVVPPRTARPANFRRKSNILSVAICTLVLPGLIATVALPAYGAAASLTKADRASIALQHALDSDSQSVHVDATADISPVLARATFGVVAPAVKPAAAGPTVRSLLANPPYPSFNLASVVSVASQYLGVPYKFGGESPSGFDCSGLVAYVYAQFGIALPHSSRLQGQIGTPIARSAALPGDVVVMDGGSHVGIYIGGGRFIDAPEPGRVVSNDLIYDNNYYIVRFGIR
jgi:cell wall-associated NlpC family hydrolase